MTASEQALSEPRFIKEEGLAARIAALAEPVARSLGYRLVRVRHTGQNGGTVQIMAERPDGSFLIDDCEKFSRQFSPVLDAEDVIKESYALEVSSPGIDRPLVRASDFKAWIGFDTKLEFTSMIDGRKRARGHIAEVSESEVRIKLDDREELFKVPLASLSEAKLVMNDVLLQEAQRRAKAQSLSGAADGAEIDEASVDIEIRADNVNKKQRGSVKKK